MSNLPVYILDKDATAGEWVSNILREIGIEAQWIASVSDLLHESGTRPPTVCLVALRPPVGQALALVAGLTQEPLFAHTAFILIGPIQYKRPAFEAGADDYLVTPPDVIELRKRAWLHLNQADLEARLRAETRITQEIAALARAPDPDQSSGQSDDPITLLEHAATLTEERNRFEIILHSAGDPLAFFDVDGTLLYANPAWEDLAGRGLILALGAPQSWPPTTLDPAANQAIHQALAQGTPWQGDVLAAAPGGHSLHVEMTISPACNARDERVGYTVTQRNITARKAQEALKTRFFTDAVVELRTPVTNIKMREYLLRQAPPDQQVTHLQALEHETERLSHLVDSMLELARIDAGLLHFARSTLDLNRLISEVVVRYDALAQERGVTLAQDPGSPVPPVEGDPVHLARAIGIVVDNAIHYTPPGGRVEVCLNRATRTGGEYATIQVRDSGIGIHADALPHIFDRFYRSDQARDSGIRGVGLGLAIAQEIISRHDGAITAESEVQRGSTFTLWLPLAR